MNTPRPPLIELADRQEEAHAGELVVGPSRRGLCAQLAAFFRARPLEWVDGQQLASIAGAYGWRTRVSELRKPPFGMNIPNRLRRARGRVISEYSYQPADEKAVDR